MNNSSHLRIFLPLLLDIFAPLAMYYLLHRCGVDDFWALTIAGLVSGINVIVDLVRKRKIGSISLFIFLMFALSIGLTFVTHNARFLLVKPSLFIAASAIYVFATTFRRPLLLTSVEPFATKGDPQRLALWENAWSHSASFRRAMQIGNIGVALILLAEAIARAVIAFSVPVSTAVVLSNAPAIVAVVLFALMGRFYLRPASKAAMAQETAR